jgi:hypothetical protein
MCRRRLMNLRTICTAAVGLMVLLAAAADASTGPPRLQHRAIAQTKLLFQHLEGAQTASPATCNEGQRPNGIRGAFLLPTLSFGSGDATFTCRVSARVVVLDLGGAIATEDDRGDIWTTAEAVDLLFTRANLERICDDLLPRVYPSAAPATLDSHPILGTQVSTRAFNVRVAPGAPEPLYQDSIDLGHPGRLAASYCGWKVEIPLRRGRHVIKVDLTGVVGADTHFTYNIRVGR